MSGGPDLAIEQYVSGVANCDGSINVGDAVYLINYIFKDGQPPCCPDTE